MRTYTMNDVIQLPRLDASGALALGAQLVNAAKAAPKLPKPLSRAYAGVASSLDVLRRANADRLPVPEVEDTKRAPTADRWIDAVLSGMFDWLHGWSKLPNEPQAEVARSLLTELYPTGLKFIQLNYKLEWAEVEARLVRIDTRGLDAKLRQLGGAAFLTQLRKAHKEYGEALGMAGVLPADAPPAGVRDAYDSFLLALRNYVLKVTAHVEPNEPETAELAAVLLAPLQVWRVGPAAVSSGGTARDPSDEQPVAEPAPTSTTAPS